MNASHRPFDEGPALPEEVIIAREAMVVRYEGNQLAVAVMFNQPVDPLGVHTAGDETVGALIGRVPANVVAHFCGASHAQQGRTHHGAVANPRNECNGEVPVAARDPTASRECGAAAVSAAWIASVAHPWPRHCEIASLASQSKTGLSTHKPIALGIVTRRPLRTRSSGTWAAATALQLTTRSQV